MSSLGAAVCTSSNRVCEVLDDANRFERAGHDLRGSNPVGLILELVLEEFGIGQYHAELVVQPVKEVHHVLRHGGL